MRIVLIEAQNRVLPAFRPHLGENARARLEKMGVEVLLNTRVLDAAERGVRLSTGEEMGCRTFVWTAGVKAETVSPPVMVFTSPCANSLPSSTSIDVTMRAPFKRAMSLRIPESLFFFKNVSKSAVIT